MTSLTSNFLAFGDTEIQAECIESHDSRDKWRFWCDDNKNGIWDEGEKFVEASPTKTDFDMNQVGSS